MPTSCAAPSTGPRPCSCSSSAATWAWATTAYGCLLAAFGLGGVLGAGVAGRACDSGRLRAVLVAALGTLALGTVLLADPVGLGGALALGVVSGAASIVVEVLADTGVQRTLAPELLARAYGFVLPAAVAGIAVGSLVAPALVALFGLRGAFVAIGVLTAGYALTLVRAAERRLSPLPAAA